MKKSKQPFSYIIFVLLIAILAFLLNKYSINPPSSNLSEDLTNSASSSPSNQSTPTVSESTNKDVIVSGVIFFLQKLSGYSEIYSINTQDNSKKLIFTDKDENLKIIQSQSMSISDKKLLVEMGNSSDDYSGSLWTISTDGKATKTKIIDNFSSTVSPRISHNGSKILYTIFSNVEPNYGFSLYAADINGQNKKVIYDDKVGIIDPIFSLDDKFAYFLSGGGSDSYKLISVNLEDNNKQTDLISFKSDEIIYSFNVYNQKVIISKGLKSNAKNQNSDIYLGQIDSNYFTKLTNSDAKESDLLFSPDGNWISFVSENDLKIISLDAKTQKNLSQEVDNLIIWIAK